MKKLVLLTAIIICSSLAMAQSSMKVSEMDSLTGEQFYTILKKEFNSVINIPIRNLNNGIYFVKVFNRNGLVKSEKIIINH